MQDYLVEQNLSECEDLMLMAIEAYLASRLIYIVRYLQYGDTPMTETLLEPEYKNQAKEVCRIVTAKHGKG